MIWRNSGVKLLYIHPVYKLQLYSVHYITDSNTSELEWVMLAQVVKRCASRIFVCLLFCLTESAVASQFKILSHTICFRSIRATLRFLLLSKMLQILLGTSSPLLNVLALLSSWGHWTADLIPPVKMIRQRLHSPPPVSSMNNIRSTNINDFSARYFLLPLNHHRDICEIGLCRHPLISLNFSPIGMVRSLWN